MNENGDEQARRRRWEQLYDRLLAALTALGRNDAHGEGDYWLVDDDWNDTHHKVCVARSDFWNDDVRGAIQEVLRDGFGDWGVYVVFETTPKQAGLVVYQNTLKHQRPYVAD